MKIKKLKNLIKSFDLFSQPVTLRYSGQPQYQTLTGGICSIALIIVFIAVFTGTLMNTLNQTYIYSTVTKFQEVDPQYYTVGTDSFIFAVGLTGINLNEGQRWFDIQLQFRNYTATAKEKTTIKLQPCERSQWTRINSNFSSFYDRLKLSQWLCPTDHLTLELQGKYTSQVFKFYKISVKQCKNSLNPLRPCVTSTQIQSFLNASQSFNLNFYFVNTILNPQNHEHISYYIDDFNYFPFSKTTGCNVNMYLSSYSVQTDQSIYPYELYRNQTGGIILSTAQVLNYEVRQKQYLKLNIRKSSLSLSILRSYRKLDDTVSYIGGLFSAILSILVIMGLYNQFSYELQIAQNLYKYDKASPIQSHKFNLLIYFGYLIFLIFFKVGITLPWTRMKIYHKSLEEVRKQIDIRFLFKKLQFVENATGAVLDQHQVKVLHLHQNLTLEQAEEIRRDYKFYDKLQKYYLQFGQEQFNKIVKSSSTSEGSPKTLTHPATTQTQNDNISQIIPHPFPQSSQFNPLSMPQNNQDLTLKNKDHHDTTLNNLDEKKQLRQTIAQLRECIRVLRKEEESGGKLSSKILGAVDQQLIRKIQAQEFQDSGFQDQAELINEKDDHVLQQKRPGQSLTFIQLKKKNVNKSFKQRRLNSKKSPTTKNEGEINPFTFSPNKKHPKTIKNLQFPSNLQDGE